MQQYSENKEVRRKLEDMGLMINFAVTIGKMIEILEKQGEFEIKKWNAWMVYTNKTGEVVKKHLCDALWSAVKETLGELTE